MSPASLCSRTCASAGEFNIFLLSSCDASSFGKSFDLHDAHTTSESTIQPGSHLDRNNLPEPRRNTLTCNVSDARLARECQSVRHLLCSVPPALRAARPSDLRPACAPRRCVFSRRCGSLRASFFRPRSLARLAARRPDAASAGLDEQVRRGVLVLSPVRPRLLALPSRTALARPCCAHAGDAPRSTRRA